MVIKNPYVWLLAAAAICLGISRYSISSWGVIFLQEAKGFDLVTAGSIMSLSPILGGVGSFSPASSPIRSSIRITPSRRLSSASSC